MNQNSSSMGRRSFVKGIGGSAGLTALALRGLDAGAKTSPTRLATFRADVTPPIGAPPCGGLVKSVAGTTPERVAVQSLHRHNAPIADSVAPGICAAAPTPVQVLDVAWASRAIDGVDQAIAELIGHR